MGRTPTGDGTKEASTGGIVVAASAKDPSSGGDDKSRGDINTDRGDNTDSTSYVTVVGENRKSSKTGATTSKGPFSIFIQRTPWAKVRGTVATHLFGDGQQDFVLPLEHPDRWAGFDSDSSWAPKHFRYMWGAAARMGLFAGTVAIMHMFAITLQEKLLA